MKLHDNLERKIINQIINKQNTGLVRLWYIYKRKKAETGLLASSLNEMRLRV